MVGTCSWSAMLVITTTYADLFSNVIVASSSDARVNITSVGPYNPVILCLRYIDIQIEATSEVSVIAVWSCSADSNASAWRCSGRETLAPWLLLVEQSWVRHCYPTDKFVLDENVRQIMLTAGTWEIAVCGHSPKANKVLLNKFVFMLWHWCECDPMGHGIWFLSD